MPDMMNIRDMAVLAKLEVSPEEELRLSQEMAGILVLARQLQQLDAEGVPQTQHILPLANILREDEAKLGLDRKTVLNAAPASSEEYIAVPRTVE